MILLLLAALLFRLAGPPHLLWPLGWLCLFPVFRLLEKGPGSYRQAVFWGGWMGFCLSLLVSPWMWGVLVDFSRLPSPVAAAVFLGYSLLAGTPWMLFFGLVRATRDRLPVLVAWPAAWALGDLLGWHLFYWNGAHTQAGNLWFLQGVDLVGVRGLNLVWFLISLGLYRWRHRGSLALALALFALTHLYGLWAVRAWEPAGQTVRVGVVQGNTPAGEQGAAAGRRNVASMVLESRALLMKERVDLLIWPEGACWPARSMNETLSWKIQSLNLLRQFGPFELIFCETPDLTNTMTLLNEQGAPVSSYRKMHLVPFSEYTPALFRKLLPPRYSFQAGDRRELMDSRHGRIFPLICYEVIRPGRLAGPVSEAQLIVNPASDTWFHSELESYQHLYLARVRAIEMRLPMVRATNSGIGAGIDRVGRMSGLTPFESKAQVVYEVRVDGPTSSFYTRWGDGPWLLILLLAVGLGARRGGTAPARP